MPWLSDDNIRCDNICLNWDNSPQHNKGDQEQPHEPRLGQVTIGGLEDVPKLVSVLGQTM